MKKSMLVILDGWGIGQRPEADAILQANTPFFDQLMKECPHSELVTYGPSVGLPVGQFGNSEVGHIHLGAGRVVWQDLGKIYQSLENDQLVNNAVIQDLVKYCLSHQKPLHLIGLLSDGGVHSHIDHLLGLIKVLENLGLENIFIHAILDGRDTDPRAGVHYVQKLEDFLRDHKSKLASLIGRYYAMDRDKRWERTSLAYQLYTKGEGTITEDFISSLHQSYEIGITDEFFKPVILKEIHEKGQIINPHDAVLCFNFRTDRLRQLTTVLTQQEMLEFRMSPLPLYFITMTKYDDSFQNIKVVFEKENIKETLGEMISRFGCTQLRIAETEKYPHVSFFFSGGKETTFSGERRVLIPSPKVATYDLKPAMSAIELTDALAHEINHWSPDFICINYANADMVGHTGVFDAVVRAVEAVDLCLQKIVPLAKSKEYQIIILADHGNAELMINPDGSPHTAHTMNPVPCILISDDKTLGIQNGDLCDIAPTLLDLMNLPVPAVMTGHTLITKTSSKNE